jgi:preprotein translocase subunit SecE
MSDEENEISGALPEAAPTVRRERKPAARAHTAGFFTRTAQFLRDVRAEMRRVSWPTANEVRNTTIITLIAVIFFALYLFGVDRIWAFLIEHLRSLLGG